MSRRTGPIELDEQVWQLPNTARGRDVRITGGGTAHVPLSVAAKARLKRIVRRAPEVMVKITGRTRGITHLKSHLDYISRNGKLVVETHDGQLIESRAELRALHDDWLATNAVMARGRNAPDAVQSVSIILSMPKGTASDRVQDAARSWARETFADRYDWIMARHDDKGHPHVHVTVRAVGNDGKRLTAGPAELQQWRERFAREMRRYGIEAEATPRKARGKIGKADPLPVYKIAAKGETPIVRKRAQHLAAIEASAASETPEPNPWETQITARQQGIRAAYPRHAAELAQGNAEERRLAEDLKRFLNEMPIPVTRRQVLAAELRKVREHRQVRQSEPSQLKKPSR